MRVVVEISPSGQSEVWLNDGQTAFGPQCARDEWQHFIQYRPFEVFEEIARQDEVELLHDRRERPLEAHLPRQHGDHLDLRPGEVDVGGKAEQALDCRWLDAVLDLTLIHEDVEWICTRQAKRFTTGMRHLLDRDRDTWRDLARSKLDGVRPRLRLLPGGRATACLHYERCLEAVAADRARP